MATSLDSRRHVQIPESETCTSSESSTDPSPESNTGPLPDPNVGHSSESITGLSPKSDTDFSTESDAGPSHKSYTYSSPEPHTGPSPEFRGSYWPLSSSHVLVLIRVTSWSQSRVRPSRFIPNRSILGRTWGRFEVMTHTVVSLQTSPV